MSQSLIELLSFLSLSLTVVFPGDGGEKCSLLLPACLKPLEAVDFCLYASIPSDAGEHVVVLSPMGGERAFLKGMRMVLYEYPEGSETVFSPDGGVYLLHAAVAPVSALDYKGNVVLEELRKSDGRSWGGGIMDLMRGGRGWVNLQFEWGSGTREPMLLIEGESAQRTVRKIDSYLAEALRGTRTQEPPGMFPDVLPGGTGKDEPGPRETGSMEELGKDRAFVKKFRQWMEEEVALHVKVWNGREWIQAGMVNPWLFRKTLGVKVGVKGVPREDGIKIRVEAPAGLWTIDRVAMDFSPEGPLPASRVFHLKAPDVIDGDSKLSVTLPRYRGKSSRAGLLSVRGYVLRGTASRPPWKDQ